MVFRSCGITSESQNIRLLLQSLSTQLAIIYDNDPDMVPTVSHHQRGGVRGQLSPGGPWIRMIVVAHLT